VSFKDLASALLGPAAAPVVAAPVEQAPVLQPTPSALVELVAIAAAETPADVVVEPVSQAMADAVAELEPALTVEALIKSTLAPAPAAPVAPVAPAAAARVPETPKPAAAALPLEFEGLKFPNDGVLTRQWMEFLSQMSTTK
jgi:hypothetical protein